MFDWTEENSMPRIPIGRRAMTVALSSMLLMAATLIPMAGITGAASGSNCSSFTSEATSYLDLRSPSSVVSGTAFTIQVAVTTDASKNIVAASDPCGSTALITIELEGPSYFNTFSANAKAGIATFNLTLAASGDYDVFAHEGPPFTETAAQAPTANCANYTYATDDFFPLTVVNIPPGAPIAPCPPDTSCTQATSGSGTQATMIAVSGSTWTPKPGLLTNPDFPYFSHVNPGTNQCGNSIPGGTDANGVLSYHLTSTEATAVIILAIAPKGQGVGLFNVCWTQTFPFTPLGGGAQVTTGDLPNCKQRDQVAPCIIAKTGGQGGKVVFLTILATANDPDPALYGH
jgi:hypothetical protein